jgi:uncharacterized phage protein (TIGR02220 family)
MESLNKTFLSYLFLKPDSYVLVWTYILANSTKEGFEGNPMLLMSRFKLSKTTFRRIIDYGCNFESGTKVAQKWSHNKLIINNIKKVGGSQVAQKWHDNYDSFKQIIEHLNERTGASYKSSSLKTQSLIRQRMKEGFKVADFLLVIDKKAKEWKETDYEKYLRPITLFGTKFETYLNEKSKDNQSRIASKISNARNRDYTQLFGK